VILIFFISKYRTAYSEVSSLTGDRGKWKYQGIFTLLILSQNLIFSQAIVADEKRKKNPEPSGQKK